MESKSLLAGLDGGVYLVDTGFEKEKPERIKEGWDGLKTIISRIRKLVHNILFFAKERELKWDRVDVLNFVDDVAATVELKIKAKGIEFVCNFDTALGAFEIDAGVVRLAEAPKSHKIVFDVYQNEKQIVFEINDNGIGMDRETRESLFTLFFSSKGNKGTGLGLFIADKIIDQHGGKISVESKPGQGSSFKIAIPKKIPGSAKATLEKPTSK
jgi:signal transduction histidine kinase